MYSVICVFYCIYSDVQRSIRKGNNPKVKPVSDLMIGYVRNRYRCSRLSRFYPNFREKSIDHSLQSAHHKVQDTSDRTVLQYRAWVLYQVLTTRRIPVDKDLIERARNWNRKHLNLWNFTESHSNILEPASQFMCTRWKKTIFNILKIGDVFWYSFIWDSNVIQKLTLQWFTVAGFLRL